MSCNLTLIRFVIRKLQESTQILELNQMKLYYLKQELYYFTHFHKKC